MPDSSEKGSFKTDIGQDVIEEALKSVERRARPAEAAPAPDPPQAQAQAEVEVPIEPAGPEKTAAEKELEELKAQLELSMAKGRELMKQVRDEHEKMLRAAADLENFKKRAAKEKEEVQKYGIERLLKDFLPVIDNLDRALEHAKTAVDFDSFRQGVAMTRKLFEDALAKNGVKAFSSVGRPFDPRFHEAMQQVETADLPANHVVSEVLRGYTLNDRLVRPALVMVSKPKAATETGPSPEQEGKGTPAEGSAPEPGQDGK